MQLTLAKLPIDPEEASEVSALSVGRAHMVGGGYDQFKLIGGQPLPLGLNTERSGEPKSRSMVFRDDGISHGSDQ